MENKNTFNLDLPCKLNQEDTQRNISKLGDISKLSASLDELEAKNKKEIDDLRKSNKEQMNTINKEISKGIGIRPVTCFKRPNLEKGIVETVRMDTNKVCAKEPITPAEREALQPSIPGLAAAQDASQNHADVLEEASKPA